MFNGKKKMLLSIIAKLCVSKAVFRYVEYLYKLDKPFKIIRVNPLDRLMCCNATRMLKIYEIS